MERLLLRSTAALLSLLLLIVTLAAGGGVAAAEERASVEIVALAREGSGERAVSRCHRFEPPARCRPASEAPARPVPGRRSCLPQRPLHVPLLL